MAIAPCVVAQCRAGFEAETVADLARIAAEADALPEFTAPRDSGYVVARFPRLDAIRWQRAELALPPIFARSTFVGTGPHALIDAAAPPRDGTGRQGPPPDPVTPLLAAVATQRGPIAAAWFEYPDTNEGKALTSLARALAARVESALRAGRALDPAAPRRLHVFLADGATAWIGTSDVATGARWPMGIARLRMPGAAPSRSVLKLAEALPLFLGDREHTLLRPGLRAVDLGAAPGGWTWLLAQRGVRVTAVDNGALARTLLDDSLVEHVRADGLSYRPRRPVDWLTCDIVEQPAKIAAVVGGWIADGAARRALFNLKLPMKRRHEEVFRCATIIDERLRRAGVAYELAIRQLYHDREEVTAYLARHD
jgi:23S rRNA (cytidine2498-2'-O)-methyltransferase